MSDELTPDERRVLDGWTALEPPADFTDRVLARQPVPRRWVPYAIAAAGCVAAAATLILVLRPTEPAIEPTVAVKQSDDAGVAVAPIVDAGIYIDGALVYHPKPPAEPYDVDLEIGQTATIHDPTGLTRINFFSRSCPSGLQVILGEAIARAATPPPTIHHGLFGVVTPVGTGSWSYRAHCMSGGMPEATIAGSGTVVIARDDGRRPLAPQPASIKVEGNGRVYRVSHAGAVPVISIERPMGGELLQVRSSKGTTTKTDVKNQMGILHVTFADLADDTYTVWFTRGGMTMGGVSTVVVAFDPTLPQIQLDLPRDGDPATPTLDVRGATVPGWSVSFEGSKVAIDTQHHFDGRVVLRTGFSSIAVRFDHPQRGTHYYVRRLR